MTDHANPPEDEEQRLARAMAELEASGIARLNYAPPVFRLARRMGLRPRPPHYLGFAHAAFSMGAFFAPVWGVAMWVVQWGAAGVPWQQAVASVAVAGVLFGLLMAGYYRWAANRADLTRWSEL